MKIRMGFVSNSSTTSFTICSSLENHNRAMQNLSLFEQFIMGKMINPQKIGGVDMIMIIETAHDGETNYDHEVREFGDISGDHSHDEDFVMNLVYAYRKEVEKSPDECFVEWDR